VALGAMVIDPNLRPRALRIDRAVLRSVFRIGLMPFLGGLFLLGMFQVERWSIAAVLGPEALGQFHLVLMYASFWGLIPASLLSTYFPPAKRAYVAQATDALKSIVRRHLRDLGIYFGLALLITVTALPWVVGAVLPDFLSSATLCYIALPGLILMTLRDSASLVMYASAQMQPLLTATILTLAAFSLCLVGLWLTDTFTLGNVLFARMFATLPGTVMLVLVQRRQVAEMVQP